MKTILGFIAVGLVIMGGFVSFSFLSSPKPEPTPIFSYSSSPSPTVSGSPSIAIISETPIPKVVASSPSVAIVATTTTTSTTTASVADRFVVPLSATTTTQVVDLLFDQGYITSKSAFNLNLITRGVGEIEPGGYRISKGMSNYQIATAFKKEPYMKWVFLKPGLRKEEIANILSETLNWSNLQKQKFLTNDTAQKNDYIEGVYFPDSYLIPLDETTFQVANRLINNFNTKFNPYLSKFNEENIKWTTGLIMASIVQREAANNADMPLIAGILWNRLEIGMPLQVDATLQYARGDIGEGYWAPINSKDKEIESPFNSYKNKGLPPYPISNPGIAAIEATLNPQKTDCIFYLHDKDRNTYCAVTFEEHKENIEKYLVD